MTFNPLTATMRRPRFLTREIEDAENPVCRLMISLRARDSLSGYLALDVADDAMTRYQGDPENGVAPTEGLPPIGGQAVRFSPSLARTVADVYVAQCDEGGNDLPDDEDSLSPRRKSFLWLYALAVTAPDAWRQVVGLWYEVNGGSKKPKPPEGESRGNASGEGAGS